jgi:hypothetical protein
MAPIKECHIGVHAHLTFTLSQNQVLLLSLGAARFFPSVLGRMPCTLPFLSVVQHESLLGIIMSTTNPELLSTISSNYSSKSETLKMEVLDHQMKLVCEQLNEKHRRWVAALLSEGLGWGGTKRVAKATGLDPKTIRQGRLDLQKNLEGYTSERVRGVGAGRPSLKKKSLSLKNT